MPVAAHVARLASLMLLLAPPACLAAAEDPDVAFGAAGRITVDDAAEPDGHDHIFQFGPRAGGGYVALVSRREPAYGLPVYVRRYTADGSADGETRLPLTHYDIQASGLMPDGRVVIAELDAADDGHRFFHLHRRLPDGSPDPSFGGGSGVVTVDEGNIDLWPDALSADAQGRIAVAGTTVPFGVPNDFPNATFVASLAADGSFDDGFGAFGMAYLELSDDDDYVHAVLRDGDGRIHVCGAGLRQSSFDAVLARFDVAGQLDATFGNAGIVAIDTSTTTPVANATDECKRLALHPNGRMHLAMRRGVGNPHVDTVRVYAVGETGAVSANPVDVLTSADQTSAIGFTFDADGRALVAAAIRATSGSNVNAALARLRVPSQVDPTFSGDGETRYSFVHAGALRTAFDIASLVVDDGHILLATNYRGDQPGFDPILWSVLRLQGDRIFDDGFE